LLGLSDLSSAFSTKGLDELKQHIQKLEELHHSSQPGTQVTNASSFETINEENESKHSLIPVKVSN